MFLLKPTYRSCFDRCCGSQLCEAVEQLGAVWNRGVRKTGERKHQPVLVAQVSLWQYALSFRSGAVRALKRADHALLRVLLPREFRVNTLLMYRSLGREGMWNACYLSSSRSQFFLMSHLTEFNIWLRQLKFWPECWVFLARVKAAPFPDRLQVPVMWEHELCGDRDLLTARGTFWDIILRLLLYVRRALSSL